MMKSYTQMVKEAQAFAPKEKSFSFEKDGLKVSYTAIAAYTRAVTVEAYGETRVDQIDDNEAAYIQTRINQKFPNGSDDVIAVGNFICEIYHGMIK
jgi:hypothetical protein